MHVPLKASVSSICYYPIKGFGPVFLPSVRIRDGGCIPCDREWAFIRGAHATEWDPKQPEKMFISQGYRGEHHGNKTKFLQLINTPSLAKYEILSYDIESKRLVIINKGDEAEALTFELSTVDGRDAFERFALSIIKAERSEGEATEEAPRLIRGEDELQFANVGGSRDKLLLHIVNEASVLDLGSRAEREIDKLRFRANIYLKGLEPWAEYKWVGKHVKIGQLELLITEPTIRCPATWVNPTTATRDMDPPALLQSLYQDASTILDGEIMALGGQKSRGGYLGAYARVIIGGQLNLLDTVVDIT